MPLQKSFSEQHKLSKRPQWQKSKSYSAAGPSARPRPLVPVSEETKNKLQRFQFQPPRANTQEFPSPERTINSEHDGDKGLDLTAIALDDSNKENHGGLAREDECSLPSGNLNHAKTPIGRLAWQDLLGETRTPKKDEEASPTERIMWRNDRDKISSAIFPMISRHGRKRARSSSPISSPSNSKPTTPAVNVKKLTQALKTPHADPALELWDRFSLPGEDRGTPSGLTNPLLAQLMISSSPRPVKDGGTTTHGESSLRRAFSCGLHWPKRRKLDRSGQDSSVTFQGSPRGDSKSSMVSALLETVTGEINKSDDMEARSRAPTSPSPSPQKKSQTRRGKGRARASPTTRSAASSPVSLTEPNCSGGDGDSAGERGSADKQSSDYGDDDFDDDTLFELDAGMVTLKDDDATLVSELVAAQNDIGDAAQGSAKPATLDDGFDEVDDDLFDVAEDMLVMGPQTASEATDQGSRHGGRAKYVAKQEEDDPYGDAFSGDFDFEAVELAATQQASRTRSSLPSLPHPSQKPKAIQRYLVTSVLESTYTDDWDREVPEKILVVQAERTKTIKMIHLRGDWYDTPASVKAFVHVIGDLESNGQCIVDNAQNILILHPDQLISSTVIADSFSCMRRAVLQDRVKASSTPSAALIYGTILHEIFQEALTANKWDPRFLGSVIDRALRKHVEDLYIIQVTLEAAREHLLSKMPEMRHWAQAFISPQPRPDAVVQGRNGEKVNMCINKLLDVEEHVWSPMYGLKGNIDATVQVTMKEGKNTKTLTVPFEVKSGKNVSSNHQAQTALYNLLLSDRYDIEIVYGILYYMETSQTLRIPSVRHELRHMIMQRNQLACHIRERSVQLPPMKKAKNACGKCFAQASCFIYHRLADDGDGETSGMGSVFDDAVKHLEPRHKEFFLKWEDLLTKEERESQKLRRELWTMVSSEREKVGRCFANVIIQEGSASEDLDKPKIFRFQYTLIKEKAVSGFSFLDSQLTVGEPIVVSDEQGHFALALGYVITVRKHSICVAVDRRLHNARIRQPGFDEVSNQVFAGIMDVAPEGARPEESQGGIGEAPVRYRLDKDEFSSGMATVRNNLVQVMTDGPPGPRQIRRLVVDLVPPRFKSAATQYVITDDDDSLNVDQKKAIGKVMSAMDYALVLGMPGTGKTTTIAHIIRALISQGKSVLLTSYTHTAVDNILLKLKKDSIPILRLGAAAKVHPEVREFTILDGQPKTSFEEIEQAWLGTPVVATTCLGINHAIFQKRTFDYCIVDEASQITLPICLGPIRMARTFVLVGDHNQLPPLVQNEEARIGGLDVSLFKLLSDTHPDSVVNLEHQYRMCEDIMTLSNTLIYNGRLKCGTEALRHHKLHIPNMAALSQLHYDAATFLSASQAAAAATAAAATPGQQRHPGVPRSFCASARPGSCWLRDLVDPSARVRFVNTDGLLPLSREEARGSRIVNPCEARLVARLVGALVATGVPAAEIGVMTHYRSQLALLRHHLRGGGGGGEAVEMHTADRFQGRDKEVVVLSLVRSNEARGIGELLRDWRRINVAFTRAKTKLLVVGSRDTLRGGSGGDDGGMLARFVELMEERRWVYDLPADALESHVFDDDAAGGTTTQGAGPGASAPTASSSSSSPSKAGKGPTKKAGARRVSPKKTITAAAPGGKENIRPGPRRARIGERALLKGKPVLRDILNDMMGGTY